MARPPDFELDPDDIVDAALAILDEKGLDAVSMRSVSSRLGVSPVPLYNRVGNKEALLDAVAKRLLADLAPPAGPGESWQDYAERWAHELRERLRRAPDSRLVLRTRRWAFTEASRPLVDAMRAAGLDPDEAVRACRMLLWATVGFVAIEAGAVTESRGRARRARLPGGDPSGVTQPEADQLFALQIRLLIEGIDREMRAARTALAARAGRGAR
jgi:TetR/AcrR family tetracycline transcriptional repressor